MTTPVEIINMALKDSGVLGVGQSALAEDINDAFVKLNWMLGQWQRKRWLVYHLIDLSLTCTGARSYTVGPGGDFDTGANPRPEKLEAAFFRQMVQSQPNEIDYPLELLQSYEDYSKIALKGLTSFPSYIFYDSGFPLARVYPWPVPQATIYAVHLIVKVQLTQFTTLTQTIDLPAEYMAALEMNLALRLAASYNTTPNPVTVAGAREALNVIRGANTQIARLQMPGGLVIHGVYNPYSDQVR